MAETVVTRIPSGAGTVTVFPTKQRTMHLVLQAVGLPIESTIAHPTDVALTVMCTIATIQEVAILGTVRLHAALMIDHQSIAAVVKVLSKQKNGTLPY